MIKFESLPNEILILCLEFLNTLEIFYSFNDLNNRFNQVIRHIPLYLNFQYVRKSIFNQFCTEILSDENIKKQIYSLHLSNEYTTGQIDAFLSFFSLDEFPHLQSLTLTEVGQNTVMKLKSMLPLLSELHYFRSISSEHDFSDVLPISKLRTLYVRSPEFLNQNSCIINLTIAGCSFSDLVNDLFKYLPMLKYLKIQYISLHNMVTDNEISYKAIHLKHLIIDILLHRFEYLQSFLEHIPNLHSLNISTENPNMVDAPRWEELIVSSLVYLKTFKFELRGYHSNNDDSMIEKFKQFQTNFWRQQHHWFTEYILKKNCICIYTVPYPSHMFDLLPYSNAITHFNTFDNVRNLSLYLETILNPCTFYFSKIISLKLTTKITENKFLLTNEYISTLKTIINLSNIKCLKISETCLFRTSSVLLALLKETSQLSSITINDKSLISYFNDNELCEYLNKKIRKLDLKKYSSAYLCALDSMEILENFCKIFSNIEQLICRINQPNDLFYLINNLSKLSTLQIFSIRLNNPENFFFQFQNEAMKYNLMYDIQNHSLNYNTYEIQLNMWIS